MFVYVCTCAARVPVLRLTFTSNLQTNGEVIGRSLESQAGGKDGKKRCESKSSHQGSLSPLHVLPIKPRQLCVHPDVYP